MALPKRRTSKARQGNREANKGLKNKSLVHCPNCQELTLPHRVCKSCGFYGGREVIEKDDE